MIPEIDVITTQDFIRQASRTYSLDGGMIDGLAAIKQAIFKILNTERYEYVLYSWDYGIETMDLYGNDPDFVEIEIKRRITEALMQDDRIESVDEFDIVKNKEKLHVTCKVTTVIGEVIINYDI